MQDATRTTRALGRVDRSRAADRLLGRIPWAVVMAVGCWVPALAVDPQAADVPVAVPGDSVVRLYATAVAQGDPVVLSDVAEVTGEAAQLAAAWAVAEAPIAGHSVTLDLAQVQHVLAQRGVNLAQWVFRGSSRCTVTRPGHAPQRSVIHADTQQASPDRPSALASTCPASPVADSVSPHTLEGRLHAHLAGRLAQVGGTLMAQFSPGLSKALALSEPTYRFQIADRSERLLGLVSLDVTILEEDKVKQVLPMLAQVSLRKKVVVAARPINRSEVVSADDLTLAERTFERIEEIGLSETTPLIGQRAKGFIQAGDRIGVKDIEPIPLVSRNDLVTVWIRRGQVVIKGSAKAMASGCYGQSVKLKNEVSQSTFEAIVTGPRTVEMPNASAPEKGTVPISPLSVPISGDREMGVDSLSRRNGDSPLASHTGSKEAGR